MKKPMKKVMKKAMLMEKVKMPMVKAKAAKKKMAVKY